MEHSIKMILGNNSLYRIKTAQSFDGKAKVFQVNYDTKISNRVHHNLAIPYNVIAMGYDDTNTLPNVVFVKRY